MMDFNTLKRGKSETTHAWFKRFQGAVATLEFAHCDHVLYSEKHNLSKGNREGYYIDGCKKCDKWCYTYN